MIKKLCKKAVENGNDDMSVYDAIIHENQQHILEDEKVLLLINTRLEADFATPIERLSVKDLNVGISSGGDDYMFPQGYSQVIKRYIILWYLILLSLATIFLRYDF